MNRKNMLKRGKDLCVVVLRLMQKSMRRARVSSEAILYQIFQNDSFVQQGSYAQFLKELEFQQDQTTKKKD